MARYYLCLPVKYLDWFKDKYPNHTLLSNQGSDYILQCLKTMQGTEDASHEWYILLSSFLINTLGMTLLCSDAGIFKWKWNGNLSYVGLATDNMLHFFTDRAAFLHLREEISTLFKVTSQEGPLLRFLNFRIIQSPLCITTDQIEHILDNVIAPYFKDKQPPRFQSTPWPVANTFEKDLTLLSR